MSDETRRGFLMGTAGFALQAGAVSIAAWPAGQTKTAAKSPKSGTHEPEMEVSPAEDLMREHGVLNRVLLIYDEAIRRLRSAQDLDVSIVAGSARLIRTFIEDYHEKLEEDYLFPRFEKAHRLTDLVAVLRAQHQAGRRVTEQIRQLAVPAGLKDTSARNQLADVVAQFVRMYRPHEAREDTVLFPALRSIVSANEYDSLGEEFEEKEHKLFGEDGFEKTVDEVAGFEKKLGIYDLSRFTPVEARP